MTAAGISSVAWFPSCTYCVHAPDSYDPAAESQAHLLLPKANAQTVFSYPPRLATPTAFENPAQQSLQWYTGSAISMCPK